MTFMSFWACQRLRRHPSRPPRLWLSRVLGRRQPRVVLLLSSSSTTLHSRLVCNLVVDTNGQRLYGFFDGLPAHLADRFEAEISRYSWNLLPANRTAGKFVKVSPTGTTMTDRHNTRCACAPRVKIAATRLAAPQLYESRKPGSLGRVCSRSCATCMAVISATLAVQVREIITVQQTCFT